MIFAQISDLHLLPRGKYAFGEADPRTYLYACVESLNHLHPTPDFVIVTGDIADVPCSSVYSDAKDILDRLSVPYYVIPGNHDNRTALYSTFKGATCPATNWNSASNGEQKPASKFLQYSFTREEYLFIALDSLNETSASGELCSTRISWLESVLSETGSMRRVLFLHHPPVATGLAFMDASRLAYSDTLSSVLTKYPAETHLLCGHVHRAISTVWNGTALHICPSIMHQLNFDLRHEENQEFVFEPPGFRVFASVNDVLISHVVYIGDYGRRFASSAFCFQERGYK